MSMLCSRYPQAKNVKIIKNAYAGKFKKNCKAGYKVFTGVCTDFIVDFFRLAADLELSAENSESVKFLV